MKIRDKLEAHIRAKAANNYWLERCQRGEVEAFPYRAAPKGKAEIKPGLIHPLHISHEPFTPNVQGKPLFLVNIPVGVSPRLQHTPEKVNGLIKQLQQESFGSTPVASSRIVPQRVAVVLGVNQIYSMDMAYNHIFRTYIRACREAVGIAAKVFGFFWKPEWERELDYPAPKGKPLAKKWEKLRQDWLDAKTLYSLKKCFLLLKVLSPEQATKVRKKYEQPEGLHPDILSQIPFQLIRERIKNSRATRDFLKTMERKAPRSPIYFTTMDADTQALRARVGGLGVFSRLGKVIADHDEPSIVSVGYQLGANEAPLLRLAVKMDMAVRSTMPMPYFPEPCTSYKVRKPGEPSFLYELTFEGRGNNLESRRFIESGREQFTDGAVLEGEGIITTTPERMRTKTNQAPTLTLAHLKKEPSLKALRGRTIQTHAFPKQWGDIFYAGLMDFHAARVTDAATPMMHIFGVFDPISRMFAGDRYTSTRFDQVLNEYGRPLTKTEKAVLAAARYALSKLKMKKDQIDSIEETARKSGAAICTVLKEAVEELS